MEEVQVHDKRAKEHSIGKDDDYNTAKEDTYILEPICLTKRRVAAGNPSFNVEWGKRLPQKVTNQNTYHMIPDKFNSCEPEFLLREAYPKHVELFKEAEDAKKKTTARKPKAAKEKTKFTQPTKLQKPITNFFVQAKDSANQNAPLCENKLKENRSAHELHINSAISSDAVSNILKANSRINEYKKNQNSKLSATKSMQDRNSIVTPAVERSKRELFRKIFEESPCYRTDNVFKKGFQPNDSERKIHLQSTPVQVSSKVSKC